MHETKADDIVATLRAQADEHVYSSWLGADGLVELNAFAPRSRHDDTDTASGPPAMAERAYYMMRKTGSDQSIILLFVRYCSGQ